ncbi:MAG: PQQ-dependent sugar dehydrogenase [Parafilimonas sp.]
MKTSSILLSALLLLSYANSKAQDFTTGLIKFSSGYSSPLDIENCGDSRLFIVQKDGRIFIADSSGTKLSTPYLDIRSRVRDAGGEQGLLGLTFDPNYSTNGYFYIDYINNSRNTQISRFKVKNNNANLADTGSEKLILQVAQPFDNHNGGYIRFGPDGYLYIGMGDGGSEGNPTNSAQDHNSLLGKMLRIDVHSGSDPYHIPPDNPFVNSAGFKKEIWSLGLRNPWRWSFDAVRGDLWIGDVGQDEWEEIDAEPARSHGGKNYGWRCYEGYHNYNTSNCGPKSDYVSPVTEYGHVNGNCAVIGGFVYRGSKYPRMIGKYFYTDYCSGTFWALYRDGNKPKTRVVYNGSLFSYTSFGEDYKKELFVVNYLNGTIYRLADNGIPQLNNNTFSGNQSSLNIYPNPSHGNFTVEYISDIQSETSITIFNSMGALVYSENKPCTTGLNKFNITLPATTKGYYSVHISHNKGEELSEKLMIE